MEIPKEVIEAAERLGISVVDVILNQLYLRDPTESIRLRLELARKYLSEAGEYVSKGDAIQASEKAYKAAEEIVKALAEKYNTPENQQAIREGRWYTHLLLKACSRLSKTLGDWVLDGWNAGYSLHVWGFS
ncbi:PaREP1 family protein [Vulcanisaeta distributa]|uniref:PaREP1 family protein n=1 Tax=Vulcanisaeta distributa TaxID=164451 RepID=UPI000AA81CBA|nr:PaREP1 family protein [Vulcanisaeta distributa]